MRKYLKSQRCIQQTLVKNEIADAVGVCAQAQAEEEIHGGSHDLPEHAVCGHAAWKTSSKTIHVIKRQP